MINSYRGKFRLLKPQCDLVIRILILNNELLNFNVFLLLDNAMELADIFRT